MSDTMTTETTTMKPRAKRRQKKLRAIQDAALDLVVAEGVEGFSVHKLADRVDLTAGALYRYFASRDEILLAVQTEVLIEFDRFLGEVQTRLSGEPLLHRIVASCRAYMALADLQPERFSLIAQLIAAPRPLFADDVIAPVAARVLAMLGRLAILLREAQVDGLLADGNAEHRAVLAWSGLHGLVERRKLGRLAPTLFDVDDLTDELLRTLLVGWGADRHAAHDAVATKLDDEFLDAALRAAQQNEDADV